MIRFIKKYCYIMVPVIISIVLVFLYIIKFFNNVIFDENSINTLVSITGSLIGFLLTSITVFLSLPKENIVMQKVKKYKHHIIFSRCVICGIIFACLLIVIWILKADYYFIILCFILSLIETIMAAYYIYKLCLYSFE